MFSRKFITYVANSCLGAKEGTDRHQLILDIYNSYADKKKMYHMKPTDSWCATFVSACFIASQYSQICPIECSCQRMIDKAKIMGIWVENDAYIPRIGDIILYDWQDNGKGDCTGWADHVGIVTEILYDLLTVVEGNKSDMVATRKIKVNSRYIRGYITPRYDEV